MTLDNMLFKPQSLVLNYKNTIENKLQKGMALNNCERDKVLHERVFLYVTDEKDNVLRDNHNNFIMRTNSKAYLKNVLHYHYEYIIHQSKSKSLEMNELYKHIVEIFKAHFSILRIEKSNRLVVQNPFTGIYSWDKSQMQTWFMQIDSNLCETQCNNLIFKLKTDLDIKEVSETHNCNYIMVNNGIYDVQHSELLPILPYEKNGFVFLRKIATNYNPQARSKEITLQNDTKFSLDRFLDSLASYYNENEELVVDKEIRKLLLDIMTEVINPELSSMAFFFYSQKAATGKSSYLNLLENIVGSNNTAQYSLRETSRFQTSSFVDKILLSSDDVFSSTQRYLDSSSFNPIVTKGIIHIEEKGKSIQSTHLICTVIAAMNQLPDLTNAEGSLRRITIVPFRHQLSYEERCEDLQQVLNNREVREYALLLALNNKYSKLKIPAICENLKTEYQKNANSCTSFIDEVMSKFSNVRCIPTALVYDLYCHFANVSHDRIQSKRIIIPQINNKLSGFKKTTTKLSSNDLNMLESILNDLDFISIDNLNQNCLKTGVTVNAFVKLKLVK